MKRNTPFKIAGDGLAIDDRWLANSRQDVQDWLAGKDDEWLELEEPRPDTVPNTPEPEFTPEEEAQQAIDKANAEARAYLSSTDWYIVRQQEAGIAAPADVLAQREDARAEVI